MGWRGHGGLDSPAPAIVVEGDPWSAHSQLSQLPQVGRAHRERAGAGSWNLVCGRGDGRGTTSKDLTLNPGFSFTAGIKCFL